MTRESRIGRRCLLCIAFYSGAELESQKKSTISCARDRHAMHDDQPNKNLIEAGIQSHFHKNLSSYLFANIPETQYALDRWLRGMVPTLVSPTVEHAGNPPTVRDSGPIHAEIMQILCFGDHACTRESGVATWSVSDPSAKFMHKGISKFSVTKRVIRDW